MKRFIEGMDRSQSTVFPDCLADWIDADNVVRAIEVFVEELDLGELWFVEASYGEKRAHAHCPEGLDVC